MLRSASARRNWSFFRYRALYTIDPSFPGVGRKDVGVDVGGGVGGGGGAGVGAADVGVGVFTLILDISFLMWQTRRPMCSTP